MSAISRVFQIASSLAGLLSLALFVFLMGTIVWPYTSGRTDIDFLLSKQHIIYLLHYRLSFYLHIFPALVVLAAGLTQFSGKILLRAPAVHRWVGRAYAYSILWVCGPAAIVMAFYANGGWLARASFLTLSVLWWWTTWRAWRAILAHQLRTHGAWMLRSYALTLSAITLRLMQFGLARYGEIDPELAYRIVAWPSWMINLLVAELILACLNWFGWMYQNGRQKQNG